MDITDIEGWITAEVQVKLNPSTTPDVKVQYLDHRMQVDHMGAEYRLNTATGWWVCQTITLAGNRLLKPAADGTPRVGKDRHKTTYSSYSKGDVQSKGDVPEWLDKLISELRPSGTVTLPGN